MPAPNSYPRKAACLTRSKHSGFPVDVGVCIQAHDRSALERLLRYCARRTTYGQMRSILSSTGGVQIRRVLDSISADSEPPHTSPARELLLWDDAGDAQSGYFESLRDGFAGSTRSHSPSHQTLVVNLAPGLAN